MFARLTGTADRGTEHLTALVLGGEDLLVATHDAQRGTAVLAMRLDDVEVASAVDRLATARGDNGITVTGFPVAVEGVTSRGSLFVGLGPPDGHHGHAALDAAVRRARPERATACSPLAAASLTPAPLAASQRPSSHLARLCRPGVLRARRTRRRGARPGPTDLAAAGASGVQPGTIFTRSTCHCL
jgi:hypothetical protein